MTMIPHEIEHYPGWTAARARIAPVYEQAKGALIAAGYREYVFPEEVPGFRITAITPGEGWHFVEIQHVGFPDEDLRPTIAAYASALESAGLKPEIQTYPLDEKIADIEIRFEYMPWPIEGLL